jgi:hypothetical protein
MSIRKPGEESTERAQSVRIAGNHDLAGFISDLDVARQFGVSHRHLLKDASRINVPYASLF